MRVVVAQNAGESVPSVADLAGKLPEIYQPIFGHPDYASRTSRPCDDRLGIVCEAARALRERLGRPLRVLDLGCAQGYFSLQLAALGDDVTGVDGQPENIALCKALAAENPTLRAHFLPESVEMHILAMPVDAYDLVLALSVFHHLVHRHGEQKITALITLLSQRTGAAVLELAGAEEPVEWAASQPSDARAILGGYPFVHELARVPTHLSEIQRPMLFASASYWYLGGDLQPFDTWTNRSHRFAVATPESDRRYFMNRESVAKLFMRNGDLALFNLVDILRESDFLTSHRDLFPALPAHVTTGINAHEAWLVRGRLPGTLLIEVMLAEGAYEPAVVIRDVLVQLAALEKQGLFHSDIRTWNVILTDDGRAQLIDYGAIVPIAKDCHWPRNLFFAFWVFVWSTSTRTPHSGVPLLPPRFSPGHLPPQFRAWSRAFWQAPPETWSFCGLLDAFDASIGAPDDSAAMTTLEMWMLEVETYLSHIHDVTRTVRQPGAA